ncbi:TetR/AcrR family transcriptional regulator [Litchfieldia salsa]|uniref:DNA-binding transcriptional regulator, AcrR family n=1 Tax=Litchfieldia salsa TaxID=930152 RepID=A0A1H0U879_9BACI|nr:TetR/AcrR family transcriptional regulator [Litchfieldia salsa]SDP62467.1 DNA-binding transcriptional regulator, AcrR family [Litchfieldia salsa]
MSPRIGLDSTIILKTAADMVNEQGLDAITLASLAKRLSVRSPSLYNHIAGLEDLKKQLAIYGIEQLYTALIQSAIGRSGNEAVHAMGDAYVSFARENPGIYEATLLLPMDPDVQQAGSKIVDLTLKILAHYNLTEDEAIHGVRGIRSILHGFASLEQKGGFGLPLDVNDSLKRLIDSYLVGINKHSGNPM